MSGPAGEVSEDPVLSVEAIRDQAPPVDPVFEKLAKDEAADAWDKLKREHLQSDLDDKKQDRKERRRYAKRVFRLLVCWLTGLGIIVMVQGVRGGPFELSNSVMLALIGSTTASVIGIFLIVANYLFPGRGRPPIRRRDDPPEQ